MPTITNVSNVGGTCISSVQVQVKVNLNFVLQLIELKERPKYESTVILLRLYITPLASNCCTHVLHIAHASFTTTGWVPARMCFTFSGFNLLPIGGKFPL